MKSMIVIIHTNKIKIQALLLCADEEIARRSHLAQNSSK